MTAPERTREDALADLADTVLEIAHRLEARPTELRDLVALTGTEIAVIREVHRYPGISPSSVAETIGISRSNVSVAVRSLETRGLLTRERSVDDVRSFSLHATPLASENLDRVRRRWVERLSALSPTLVSDLTLAAPLLARLADELTHRQLHSS